MGSSLRRLLVPILAVLCTGLFFATRLLHASSVRFTQADLWTLAVALLLTVIALFAPAVQRRRLQGLGASLPWAALFFLLAWMVGVLVQMFVDPDNWIAAPIAAFVVGAFVFVQAWRLWFWPLGRVYRLQSLKSDPAALDAAVGKLLSQLRVRPQTSFQARRHAQVAIVAGSVLAEMRRWNDALAALDCVLLEQVDPARRSFAQATKAVALLYLGQRRAAWDAMSDANRHGAGLSALQRSLEINAEVIASLDGPPGPVLQKLDELGKPKEPLHQRGWLLARANALAASGDHVGARATLQELAAVAPDGLERAIELNGPASELARQMREG